MSANRAAADLLILTEQQQLPSLRELGQHESADLLIRETPAHVNDPKNAETVALTSERDFRWGESGD